MRPVQEKQRFESLDVLRGIGVLGILAVNVQAFAMYFAAYDHPPAHMDVTGINLAVWAIQHTFFELKFITIFSALFGAGIMLMVGEGEDLTGRRRLHFSRMRWLLVFGLIHAYVFWYGDVLTAYAIVGMIAVYFRQMSVKKLVFWGGVWIAISGLLILLMQASAALMPAELSQGEDLTFGTLPPAALNDLIEAYREGFIARLPYNVVITLLGQLQALTFFGGRLIGVMFLGMALFKCGFLTLHWQAGDYIKALLIGGVLGGACVIGSTVIEIADNFSQKTYWIASGLNYVGSLGVALAYASAVMVICQAKIWTPIRDAFANVGRMAFTNYLTQTFIMTLIFVGPPGLGLFGQVERWGQALIVIAVWALQLIWSTLWLKSFTMGPLEWFWRGLAYGKFPAFKRRSDPEPSEA
ncbi:DUF418 domain-containing protein [Woodsholea maritima]|uniref:DUF418 domain-containing protein n=1 Tax=Woodsholea maritima TaxID=240237 RepID=UPI0003692C57|nr:DUF418 domain-containing protein [Woodsholea maritima]